MDKFLDRFSNFFVRSVAPSSIFFVLLFFNDMYFNDSKIKDVVVNITKAEDKKETPKEISLNIKDLKNSDDKQQIVVTIDKLSISDNVKKSDNDKSKDTDIKSNENPNINLIYVFMAFIFIAYGYLNQILTQILDNFIKSNYEFCIEDKNHNEYRNFRSKVYENLTLIEKDIFSIIEFNDYNAYQVLGKVLNNNYTYVDDIKSIHTFFLAICFNLFISFSFFHIEFLPLLIILIPIILIIGNLLARNRYMIRNKRMYINYLLNKEENQINKGGSR